MVSLTSVPEILYLDDRQVEQLFSYINEGDIVEVAERSSESGTVEKGGGLKKIIALRYSSSETDGEKTEWVRELDPIGKFAALHSTLGESEDIVHLNDLDDELREDISEGAFVQAKGKIAESPVNELHDLVNDLRPYFDMFDLYDEIENDDGGEFGFNDIQRFLEEIKTSEDLFWMDIPSENLETKLVFPVSDSNLRGSPDFPSKHTEYRILGRVEHIYDEGEEEWLMDLMEIIPDNSRESRQQRRTLVKQMATSTTELLGRDVNESDFKITYPDIRIRPMAIYLF